MNKFKSIIMSLHTQNKRRMHELYTDRQVYISSLSSAEQPVEEEKKYSYRNLFFKCEGTGYRTVENIVIYVYVSENLLGCDMADDDCKIPYEDFLLRQISDKVNELSEEFENDHKSSREKPEFSVQKVNSKVIRRNGCIYIHEEKSFRIRIHYTVPLINGININGKATFKSVRSILDIIANEVEGIDKVKLSEHIKLCSRQEEIRKFLEENEYIAFVGNGSTLPRQGDTDEKMQNAVVFEAPKSLKVDIPLSDGKTISGMGIKRGITIITGGGYSGKSTLLDALESGIYNHINGDGREYVLTDRNGCKIYAEDGRYIENADISPFFNNMSGGLDVKCFSTNRASGSVSQATSIIEAVYGGCKLLMIDEDTSATNFMIRDNCMRMLVHKEPIIPFTDRVEVLKEMNVSTILVIGGSSEYLKYADTVLIMEDYMIKDKTDYVADVIRPMLDVSDAQKVSDTMLSANVISKMSDISWTKHKEFVNEIKSEFFYSECIKIENARYIKIDEYVSDVTKVTAISTDEQINSLTYLLEKILGDESGDTELLSKCSKYVSQLFDDSKNTTLSNSHKYDLWLEEVRVLDLLMTVCRMRR